jgi:hypothetical protein
MLPIVSDQPLTIGKQSMDFQGISLPMLPGSKRIHMTDPAPDMEEKSRIRTC